MTQVTLESKIQACIDNSSHPNAKSHTFYDGKLKLCHIEEGNKKVCKHQGDYVVLYKNPASEKGYYTCNFFDKSVEGWYI